MPETQCVTGPLTAAMVTSTSTPGSREMEVICLTTSAEEVRSINRLWILISYLSQVLEPSPHGLLICQLHVLLFNIHSFGADSRLSGGVLQELGWESDGSLDVKVSVLGPVNEVTTDYDGRQSQSQ